MEKFTNEDIVAMLTVIYKKIENIECKVTNKNTSLRFLSSYLEDLKKEAKEVFK